MFLYFLQTEKVRPYCVLLLMVAWHAEDSNVSVEKRKKFAYTFSQIPNYHLQPNISS